MRFKYISFFFVIHCFFVFSYELSSDYNFYNAPYVEMQIDYNVQQPTNSHFPAHAISVPDYSNKCPAHYTVLAQASSKLRDYFTTIVSPLLYDATIKNHYAAIPGYTFPDGLRHCVRQLSQFSRSDGAIIATVTKRLETYCTCIESILFNGKNHSFCDTISPNDQIKLVRAYADFLKEFYAQGAFYVLDNQSQDSPLMRQLMPSIKWDYYSGNDSKMSPN